MSEERTMQLGIGDPDEFGNASAAPAIPGGSKKPCFQRWLRLVQRQAQRREMESREIQQYPDLFLVLCACFVFEYFERLYVDRT